MATDNSFCPLCTAKIAAAGRVYINPRAKRYEANICFVPDRDRVQNRDLSDNDMIYGPGLLRALHAIRDPRRYDVLQDMLLLINDWVRYYDDAGTWEQLEAKFCVELTNTLLEIVADLSAYTFDDDKGVSGPFLQNLFACLAISMDYYTMLSATDYLPNMNIESTSKKADRLFTFIWSHKGLLNRPHKEGSRSSESGSTWYLADYVLRVACGTRHIMHIRKDTTPSALITESRYYHILLYCWLGNQKYALDSHATTGLSLLSAYISYNEPHNSGKLMGSLVRSAITPDLAHSLTNKVSMMLADPTLSSQTLHNLLAISSSLLLECQQFLNPSSDEALERLMNNWCAVVERNICLGGLLVEERAAPNRHGQDGLIMAMGWKVIGETIEQRCGKDAWHSSPSVGAYRRMWLTFMSTIGSKIVPLIAYTIEHHIKTHSSFRKELTCAFMLSPLKSIETFLTRPPLTVPKASLAQLDALKTSIRSVWYPTMTLLTDICAAESKLPQNPSLHSTLSTWSKLGKRCKLDPLDPLTRNPELAPRSPIEYGQRKWWKSQGCTYDKCLCQHDPYHRMKRCKGCWKAVYCGVRCQALDWKGGHNKSCPGRRSYEYSDSDEE